MKMKILYALIGTLALAGCQTTLSFSHKEQARAELEPRSGSSVSGYATFEEQGDKVIVMVKVKGLKPNQEHGFHVHDKGDCSAPDASSAGGHFNPDGHAHGNPDQTNRHAGAMKNLVANNKGEVETMFEVDTIRVASGKYSIVNHALIIHANPDDYKSQPVGNAGGRIACGIIKKM